MWKNLLSNENIGKTPNLNTCKTSSAINHAEYWTLKPDAQSNKVSFDPRHINIFDIIKRMNFHIPYNKYGTNRISLMEQDLH